MRFQIENVARVEKAHIQLDGITVVAGGNGCGKSTISKAMYAVLDSYYRLSDKIRSERLMSARRFVANWIHREAHDKLNMKEQLKLKVALCDYLLMYNHSNDEYKEEIPLMVESHGIPHMNQKQLLDWLQDFKNRDDTYYLDYILQREIRQIFSDEVNTFNQDTIAHIVCDYSDNFYHISVDNGQVLNGLLECIDSDIQPIYITTSDLIDSVGSYDKLDSARRVRSVSSPNSKLAQLLMNEISLDGLVAEEYEELRMQSQIGKDIFKDVLEGDLYLENNKLQYHDKVYQRDIALSNLASGMRIFLIIKRLIENGSFLRKSCLIIDEPETNLHPEWQLKLAHLLVLLHKKLGILVYVNSHSPYLVRAMEYYADELNALDVCTFYSMEQSSQSNMYYAKDVTEELGHIYDKLAGPFNQIM